MLWSTNGFPVMANGTSSISTPNQQTIRALMAEFPDADSVARLRSIGMRSVVVLGNRVAGTPYAGTMDRPATGLGITRTMVGGDLLFTLG